MLVDPGLVRLPGLRWFLRVPLLDCVQWINNVHATVAHEGAG